MLANAQSTSPQTFEITPQNLSSALTEFARQSGTEILYSPDIVSDKSSPGVRGKLDPMSALTRLLSDSGLTFTQTPQGAILLQSTTQPAAKMQTIALVQESVGSSIETASPPPASSDDSTNAARAVRLEEVVVTGSQIRGVEQKFSPVITATREELDRQGFSNVNDFILQLPQNFGGGVSPGDIQTPSSGINAAGANLRGLGNEATLVLVNGRRVAPGGNYGNFVNINAVPTTALERVDVLTDGASAVYGSDAIAGVVNFVLREDYRGVETRARLGMQADGARMQYQLGQTLGTYGERGRALLSYQFNQEDALDANERSFSEVMLDPSEILAATTDHSVYFTGGLNVGSTSELFADFYSNKIKSHQKQAWYSFLGAYQETRNESMGGALGLRVPFADTWLAEISAAYSRNDYHTPTWYFDPADMQQWFNGNSESETSVATLDVKADGALFRMSGGDVRLVVGSQYRQDYYEGYYDLYADGVQAALFPYPEHKRKVAAVYSELYAPFVSTENARPGVRELSLSLAARYEDYNDFGSTFNPKLGLAWSPMDGLTLRGTVGTSYRAPNLSDLNDSINGTYILDYVDPSLPGGRAVAFMVSGNRSDLAAEEATAWTVGIDLAPAVLEGFTARLTYFDINYKGRIATPYPELNLADYTYYDYPLPLPPVGQVDWEQIQAWAAASPTGIYNYTEFSGTIATLEDVTLIIDQRTTNTARSRSSGVDLLLNQSMSLDVGYLGATLAASYLIESTDQFSSIRPVVQNVGTIFKPARLRGYAGLAYSRDGFSASLMGRYVHSYKDDMVVGTPAEVDAWITLDANVSWDLGKRYASGPLSGLKVSLAVRNLLNEDPPSVTLQPNGTGSGMRWFTYDPANADPEGRGISLTLVKAW